MIGNIFLLLGIFIILFCYLKILFIYITNKDKNGKISGSENVRGILNDDSVINVVENKSLMFSKYNIKRKMIKLSSSDYDGQSYFVRAVTSLLSGYATSNSKYLNIISYVFKEIKFITFSPIISIILSLFVYNVGDAKIGIVLLGIILVYQYMLVMINGEAFNNISNSKVSNIIKVFVDSYTAFFVASLLLLLRLVVIVMGI